MDNFNGYTGNNDRFEHKNYNSNYNRSSEDVVSLGTWIGVIILLAIPIINFIVLLAMAFMDMNQNLKNFARATLILIGVGLVFGILFGGCMSQGLY